MHIGVLAIQGSVIEHKRMLEKLGVKVQEVRLPQGLENIKGVILPGGESTTQSKLLKTFGLFDPLQKKIAAGLPAWGTCAGAILLAKEVRGKNVPETLAVMDIIAERNWYGGQLDSFIAPVAIDLPAPFGSIDLEGVFIRAPKLAKGRDEVQILAERDGVPIFLQQKNMLASAFHPELTTTTKVHEYFLSLCAT